MKSFPKIYGISHIELAHPDLKTAELFLISNGYELYKKKVISPNKEGKRRFIAGSMAITAKMSLVI
jgi:hypothetical protein